MAEPATGTETWDFAVTKTYKTSSRHTRVSHPHRQNRDADVRKRSFVGDMRKRFASCVNEVMATVDAQVRFDPRSYKAMGLDVAPMESVYRVTADRLHDGKLVIQDVEWTRRMVAVKMREAAIARDPDVEKLRRTTKALEELRSAWPNLKAINARVGPKSRLASLAGFTRKSFAQVISHRIALEHAIVERRVVGAAELAVCREVMEAARVPRSKGPRHKDLRTAEEQDELRTLFEVAGEEHAAVAKRMAGEMNRLARLVELNKQAWRASGAALSLAGLPKVPPAVEPDPVTSKVTSVPRARTSARAEAQADEARVTAKGVGGRPPADPSSAPKKEAAIKRASGVAGSGQVATWASVAGENVARTPEAAPAAADAEGIRAEGGANAVGKGKPSDAAKPMHPAVMAGTHGPEDKQRAEGARKEALVKEMAAMMVSINASMGRMVEALKDDLAKAGPGEFDAGAFIRSLEAPTKEAYDAIDRIMRKPPGTMWKSAGGGRDDAGQAGVTPATQCVPAAPEQDGVEREVGDLALKGAEDGVATIGVEEAMAGFAGTAVAGSAYAASKVPTPDQHGGLGGPDRFDRAEPFVEATSTRQKKPVPSWDTYDDCEAADDGKPEGAPLDNERPPKRPTSGSSSIHEPSREPAQRDGTGLLSSTHGEDAEGIDLRSGGMPGSAKLRAREHRPSFKNLGEGWVDEDIAKRRHDAGQASNLSGKLDRGPEREVDEAAVKKLASSRTRTENDRCDADAAGSESGYSDLVGPENTKVVACEEHTALNEEDDTRGKQTPKGRQALDLDETEMEQKKRRDDARRIAMRRRQRGLER